MRLQELEAPVRVREVAARKVVSASPRLSDVWTPQPGPQTIAFRTPPRCEIFYGGARGGGKTDTAIALAIDHCLRYGEEAKCLIVRCEYRQLRDLRERGKQLCIPLGAVWRGGEESAFIFRNGARIYLGHCRTVEDAEKWQGWGVNFLLIEELPNWPDPEPIRRLFGAVRSAHGVPSRWYATGNPGGRGHAWVKEEWIDGAEPYRPREVRDEDGRPLLGADGEPVVRIFIPARVEDNPKLLENDPGYIARLERQAKHLAAAWRHGDWEVAPGAFLEGTWDATKHVIDDFDPPYWWPRWISIDWGFAKPYSVGWYVHRPEDGAVIRYREMYGYGGRANLGTRESASEVAQRVLRAVGSEPPTAKWRRHVADASMWAEQGHERGVSIAATMRAAGLLLNRGPREQGSRVATLQLLVDRLKMDTFYVTKSCRHWLRTVPILAPDPDHPEDVDTEAEDHAMDETRYALWMWHSQHRGPRVPRAVMQPSPMRPRIASASGPRDVLTGQRAATTEDMLAFIRKK